jgi:nitrogen fixation NifU-like protein
MAETYGYSDKVMEIFRSPHNMGEIKNPDAVGKVGNAACLLPNTMIHVNDKLIEIKDADESTKVLGHDGFFNKVQRTISRDYSGNLISIKNKMGTTLLTPEHEVFSVKLPKMRKYAYTKHKKTLTPDWNNAEILEKGDLIVYPISITVVDKEYIETPQERKKWDYKGIKIPKKIRTDADFLRFCGYYLAEGSIVDKVTKTRLTLTFNINEVDLIEDAERIVRNVFGIEAKRHVQREKNKVDVVVNNVFVVRMFKSIFGNGAANKKIPHWMMLLHPKKQKSLLYGCWWGDGYINKKRPRAGYSTISYQLAHQIKILLIRQKIAPSIYVEDEKISNDGVKHKKAYRIHVGERIYLERLAKILGIHFSHQRKVAISSWFDRNFLFTPLTRVEKTRYSGNVHNLEIENSKSYVTDSLAVHNCGDMMYLYLKIGKNKAGEEVIEDAKVKTFGCVAAVSTSSVLTDMIIGKTLKEAMGVTKQDIVDILNGLPKIKIHCSILAIDALKEAVYDYYKRKGKPIPEGIKKVHERVEKVNKAIEHRHGH